MRRKSPPIVPEFEKVHSPSKPGDYDGRTVLVTGGLGFIGSNLVHCLAAQSRAEIRIVDSLHPACGGNPANLDGLPRPVSVHVFDMRDGSRLLKTLAGVDVVFNLVSHSDSMKAPLQDLQANAEAQLALLEACRRACPKARVVYASTRQCYGRPQRLPVDEEHPVVPIDVNGVNKYAAECYHRIYLNTYGLETCTLRLTNTYGPRQMIRNARQGFIGWFLHQALCGREITVFGDGSQLRDLNYVACVVDAFLLAGLHPGAVGGTYNLGSDEPISLLELARLIVRLSGTGTCRTAPFPSGLARIDIGDYGADFSRIRRGLGWQPRVPLREGLLRTIRFFRQHRDVYLGSEAACTSPSLTWDENRAAAVQTWSGPSAVS